jgi:hypothetical protein
MREMSLAVSSDTTDSQGRSKSESRPLKAASIRAGEMGSGPQPIFSKYIAHNAPRAKAVSSRASEANGETVKET